MRKPIINPDRIFTKLGKNAVFFNINKEHIYGDEIKNENLSNKSD